MNGDPEMHEALETIREVEGWLRRERIRLALRSLAIASVFLLLGRVCEDTPILMWFSYAMAAVMFLLGIWDIIRLTLKKGK